MKRLLIIALVVATTVVAGLTTASPAYAGHCIRNPEAVLQQGSTVWGRGTFYCSPGTSLTATVCLERWTGSSWLKYNCNTWSWTASGGWTWGYSYADDCSSSNAFRSVVRLYSHGEWGGWENGYVHNC